MVKRGMILLVVGAVAFLGACGSQDEGPEPTVTRIASPSNVPIVSPTTAGGATTLAGTPTAPPSGPVQIALKDIFFEPTEVTIPANTDVTITLVNQGVTVHTFDIDALNVKSGDVQPGATATVTVNAAAGDYEYYCAVPGHREAGMVGTLRVVEGGAPPPAAGSPTPPPAGSPAPLPGASPTASPAGSTVALVGDVTRGQGLAMQCLACHSTDGSTQVGPTWKGLYGKTETFDDGSTAVVDDAYLRESIVNPTAKTVQGFPAGVMPPYNYLTDQQIADLIAYIKSLQE